MLLIQDGFVVVATGTIKAVVEAHTMGVEQPIAVAAYVEDHEWSEVFAHARIELHQTVTRQGEHGPMIPTAYLTITVPLNDDESLRSAYRLQDHARSSGSSTSSDAGEERSPTLR